MNQFEKLHSQHGHFTHMLIIALFFHLWCDVKLKLKFEISGSPNGVEGF
jgi:hypothetical protein